MECQVFQIIQLFASENGGEKNNPPLPLGDINYFYSLQFKLLFNFTREQPNCYKEVKNLHCPYLFFPVSVLLQSFLEVLSGVVVMLEAGRKENGRLAFQDQKRRHLCRKSIYLKKILLSYVYPIQGTPCCLVHEVKSVQAKMEITQPALSLYPNPSRQLLNCCCSWNSKGDQGGSNLITHLHEKFRPPPVLRAPHQRSDETKAIPSFTCVIQVNLGRVGI